MSSHNLYGFWGWKLFLSSFFQPKNPLCSQMHQNIFCSVLTKKHFDVLLGRYCSRESRDWDSSRTLFHVHFFDGPEMIMIINLSEMIVSQYKRYILEKFAKVPLQLTEWTRRTFNCFSLLNLVFLCSTTIKWPSNCNLKRCSWMSSAQRNRKYKTQSSPLSEKTCLLLLFNQLEMYQVYLDRHMLMETMARDNHHWDTAWR